MDAASSSLAEERARLLQRLAEIVVEEQRARGVIARTPHLTELEGESLALGQLLSRLSLARSAAEVAVPRDVSAACPACGERHPVAVKKRTVESLAGPIELVESAAHCPAAEVLRSARTGVSRRRLALELVDPARALSDVHADSRFHPRRALSVRRGASLGSDR